MGRKNRQNISDEDKVWRATRIKGKKAFIKEKVIKNGVIGFLIIFFLDTMNFQNYQYSMIDGFNIGKRILALVVLVFLGTWFHAQAYWRKKEKEFIERSGEVYKEHKLITALFQVNVKPIDYILKSIFVIWAVSFLTYVKIIFAEYKTTGAYIYDVSRIVGLVLALFIGIRTDSRRWQIVAGIFYIFPAATNLFPI